VPKFSVNPSDARHNVDNIVSDGLSGRGFMTSSGHVHRSFNKITGNWVNELRVTLVWCITAANWNFLNPTFHFNFGMSLNSGILRWFRKMSFLSQKAVCISRFRLPLFCLDCMLCPKTLCNIYGLYFYGCAYMTYVNLLLTLTLCAYVMLS